MSSDEKKGKAEHAKIDTIVSVLLQKSRFINENGDLEALAAEVSKKYDEMYKIVYKARIQSVSDFEKKDIQVDSLNKKCAKCTKKKCTNCINKK
jgi:hypothetical protein